MRAWRTLTDPSQLWHFPFCCRQPLAADPASPPGDVPSLNERREIRCEGSQGCQVPEVSGLPVMGKVMREVSFIFYQLGCFPLHQAALKNPQKRKKRHQAPLRTDFITAMDCSACQLPSAWCSSSKRLFRCLGQLCQDTACDQEALPQRGHLSWQQILLSLSLAQKVAEVLAIGGREKQGPPGHLIGTSTWVWC